MNTRLFPKGLGANKYRISGLAALCDMVILSDYNAPKSTILKNCEITNTVTTVFVSMRNFEKALLTLNKEVLSVLCSPFIVIIASEDVTFPKQLDKRFKAYSQEARQIINSLFLNPHLQHCYVENLSHYVSPKVSPIPLGLVDPDQKDICADSIEKTWPLEERKLSVFCCHRIRSGEQWRPRLVVNELAKNYWSSFCTLVTDEIPLEDYYDKVREHAFTLCVEGGGHDPSPKAFQVILKGGIPIIKSSALNPAYALFNCVIVDDWSEEAITEDKLKNWYANEINNRINPNYLRKLHYMLTIDFWWGNIKQAQSIMSLGSSHGKFNE